MFDDLSPEQQDVKEWEFILEHLHFYDLILGSDGNIHGVPNDSFYTNKMDLTYDKPDYKGSAILGFIIQRNEYKPGKKLEEIARQWLKRNLQESIVDTL